MLRYKLSAFSEAAKLDMDAAEVEAAEKLMKLVSPCLITLNLYDADGFILRKIPVPFSLGIDDRARVNSVNANDVAQMDGHSYRDFVGTSNRGGSWNVSWDCGPEDHPPARGAETKNPPNEEDSKEHRVVEQLRAKAEAIKKCPEIDQSISEFSMLEGKDAGQFRRRVSAPVNVTWDVEEKPSSTRSPEVGFIEFTTNASCDPTLSLVAVTCKRNDDYCWAASRADSQTYNQESEYCQNLKPNQYRYEFDFGTEGLEFARALRKPENADKSLWAAFDLEHGTGWTDAVATSSCIADAVRLSVSSNTPRDTLDEFPPSINVELCFS